MSEPCKDGSSRPWRDGLTRRLTTTHGPGILRMRSKVQKSTHSWFRQSENMGLSRPIGCLTSPEERLSINEFSDESSDEGIRGQIIIQISALPTRLLQLPSEYSSTLSA